MTKPNSKVIGTGVVSPSLPDVGYVSVQPHAIVPRIISTSTRDVEGRSAYAYSVSISSQATTVGLYFDPVLAEKNERTASLNKAIQNGYVPPAVSTRG